jgi:hypothetical protein
MIHSCIRCDAPAAALMTFDYAAAEVWLDDVAGRAASRAEVHGYLLCVHHADRLAPPVGWSLGDRRTSTRLFAPREVA